MVRKKKLPSELPEPVHFIPEGELLASYGSHPEVWKATGYGTVFVVRQTSEGKVAVFGAILSLSEEGISRFFAKLEVPPGNWRGVREMLAGQLTAFPAMISLPPETVAEYLYGAPRCLSRLYHPGQTVQWISSPSIARAALARVMW